MPRSSSIADDSDAEFDPTPIHSPEGPQYDDLPPSYDEAQHQAVADARNGIAPLDPNQLEAHRLTLNEGPNEPEVWEYRMRGDQPEATDENELAPEYTSHSHHLGSTVPVQHVGGSDSIPVGQIGSRSPSATTRPDPATALLDLALGFTQHAPDADAQYAPRLTRSIAIPQEGFFGLNLAREKRTKSHGPASRHGEQQLPENSAASYKALDAPTNSSDEPVQFLRAYAKSLHAHSIRPAEFTEFLDGLNTLCKTTNTTAEILLCNRPAPEASSTIVHEYVKAANEAFFAPRGLKVSLQPLVSILEALKIPAERGQYAGTVASILDKSSTAEKKAQALYPWIESLDTNVPSQSSQTLILREMGDELRGRNCHRKGSPKAKANSSSAKTRTPVSGEKYPDPPHSIPEPTEVSNSSISPPGSGRYGFGQRGYQVGNPWMPFNAPGNGSFGPLGHSPFGPSRFGPHSPPHCGRGRNGFRSNRSSTNPNANDWTAWGENVGKLGEEFGKMMGEWGQQFGKQAEVWGQHVGRQAEAWGEEMSARSSASGAQNRGPTSMNVQTHEDLPPSYTNNPAGQEAGILYSDNTTRATDDHDEDTSSMSSDSSDSDSDSDSDNEDYVNNESIFLKRIHSINEQADVSAKKGKKSLDEIARERALAIERAQNEKTASDLKIEEKNTKRAIRQSLRQKGRELKKQHSQKKRELSEKNVGKGKGKAKKSKEWREANRDYKEKRKQLRREKLNARKEWQKARYERKKLKREGALGGDQDEAVKTMAWLVIENRYV